MGRKKSPKKKDIAQSNKHSNGQLSVSIGATQETMISQDLSTSPKRSREEDGPSDEDTSSKRRKVEAAYPSLTFAGIHKLQSSIKIGDLQQLLLYCLADAPGPQWVAVGNPKAIKKAALLHVPALNEGVFAVSNSVGNEDGFAVISSLPPPDEYLPSPLCSQSLSEEVEPLAELFQHVWPIRAHGDSRFGKVHSPLHSMLTVPLPKPQELKSNEKNGAVSQQGQSSGTPTHITDYLASIEQMRENDYPTHLASDDQSSTGNGDLQEWVRSSATGTSGIVEHGLGKEMQDPIADYQVLAMDCEMCESSISDMELTRISLIDWSGKVVMDELVKPPNPITDYRTPYSGITPAMLEYVTTTLHDIQFRLLEILTPKTILIGHSLESDLKSLKLTHPFIVDTSLLFPHPRGPPLKSSLKWLAKQWLGREIQKGHGSHGHDSIEDATACLDLVKSKCTKGPLWGATEADRESIFKRIVRANPGDPVDTSTCGAIIDDQDRIGSNGAMGARIFATKDLDEVVSAVDAAVQGKDVAVPGGFKVTHATLRSTDTGQIVKAIKHIHTALPPGTLLVVYSGLGDLTELRRLQATKRTFEQEHKTKKWDELSVKWTDTEQQAMRNTADKARKGVALMCVR